MRCFDSLFVSCARVGIGMLVGLSEGGLGGPVGTIQYPIDVCCLTFVGVCLMHLRLFVVRLLMFQIPETNRGRCLLGKTCGRARHHTEGFQP